MRGAGQHPKTAVPSPPQANAVINGEFCVAGSQPAIIFAIPVALSGCSGSPPRLLKIVSNSLSSADTDTFPEVVCMLGKAKNETPVRIQKIEKIQAHEHNMPFWQQWSSGAETALCLRDELVVLELELRVLEAEEVLVLEVDVEEVIEDAVEGILFMERILNFFMLEGIIFNLLVEGNLFMEEFAFLAMEKILRKLEALLDELDVMEGLEIKLLSKEGGDDGGRGVIIRGERVLLLLGFVIFLVMSGSSSSSSKFSRIVSQLFSSCMLFLLLSLQLALAVDP